MNEKKTLILILLILIVPIVYGGNYMEGVTIGQGDNRWCQLVGCTHTGIIYFNAPVFFRDNVTLVKANSLEINTSVIIKDFDGTIKIILNASGSNLIDGNLNVTGDLKAGNFIGDGSQLTNINATGSIWNKTGSNIYPADLSDNVGIGTANPTEKLEVNGNIKLDDGSGTSPALDFTDQTNDIAKIWKGDAGNLVSTIYGDNADGFHFALLDRDASGTTNDYSYLLFGLEDDGGGAYNGAEIRWILSNATATEEDMELAFYTAADGGSRSEQMRIDENGNVGIGTTTPSEKLEILNGNVLISKGADNASLRVWESASTGGITIMSEGVGNDWSIYRATSGIDAERLFYGGRGTSEIHSDVDTFSIAGNVGIGNTTPQHKLSVNGDIYTNQTVFASGINITGSFFDLTADENNSLRFTIKNLNNGSGAAAVITAENNVGGTMSIGVVSEKYMIGDMSYPNATTLISRSKGDMAFVNSYDKAFSWLYNPSDDDDLNNLVEIMKLDEKGLNVSTNITADNVFLPQYIFAHNNETMSLLGASTWTNVTFTQEEAHIKLGITHTHNDATNTTFTINVDGIYDIDYDYDMIDTSASSTDIDVAGRVIYSNGTEIDGSVFETDITKKDIETEVSHDFLAELKAGDKIVFQFVAADADVRISTHGSFGIHPESATIRIFKIANLP